MEDDHKKIEELKKDLYSRDFPDAPVPPRSHFAKPDTDVSSEWKHEPAQENIILTPHAPKVTAGSFFKKILTISVIFFILCAGLAVYIFFKGLNIVTTDRVDIAFVGPVAVGAGEELNFDVVVQNKNSTELINAEIYIQYPEGTKQVADLTQDLTNQKEVLGNVAQNTDVRKNVRAVIFGEQHAQKQITVTLEYGLKNATARYRKEKVYDVNINSSPLTMVVTHPREVISNQEVDYEVLVTSNATVPLSNVVLTVQYPFGFTLVDVVPAGVLGNTVWTIPTLAAGEQKKFVIRGKIEGEQGDERVLRFNIGTAPNRDAQQIAINYLTAVESVVVRKPPLQVAVTLGNSTAKEYITEQGSTVGGSITITNNLPNRVVDATIQLNVDGVLFDSLSASAGSGFYRSSDKTFIWNKSTQPSLALLNPGQSVSVPFQFKIQPVSAGTVKNGVLDLRFAAAAKRAAEDGTEQVNVTLERTIKTRTSIGFTPRLLYSIGPFRNSGPVPPKANTKTTYTVNWAVTNSANDVSGAEVKATLPTYVRWLNAISPTNEKVTWNPERNEVVWYIGDIPGGVGITKPVREVSFQVELETSSSQINTLPAIVNQSTMTAIDMYTKTPLSVTRGELTTNLSTDPKYSTTGGSVTQ